jgi:cytidylate kinase
VVDRVLDEKEGYIDEEVFIDLLNEIVAEIAEEGNVVILGRGGQYILKDRKDVFHVLAIAHLNDRIRFMEKHYYLSTAQATQAVNREDKRRSSLYRKLGRQDYDRPDIYHVVLNMSKVKLEKACDLICDLIKQ